MLKAKKTLASALLTTTALGGTGYAVHQQQELDGYIAAQIAASLADNSWQQRTAEGTALYDAGQQQNAKIAAAETILDKGGTIPKTQAAMLNGESKRINDEWIAHYKNADSQAKQTVREMLQREGIGAKVNTKIVASSGLNAITRSIEDEPELQLRMSSAMADKFTAPEMRFTLAHEISGHVKYDFTDAKGNMLPGGTFSEPSSLSLLPRGSNSMPAREERADRAAARATCDPDAATRLFAKGEANDRNVTLEQLQGELHDEMKPGGIAGALVERFSVHPPRDGKHPYWKDRIKAVREEAAAHCTADQKAR